MGTKRNFQSIQTKYKIQTNIKYKTNIENNLQKNQNYIKNAAGGPRIVDGGVIFNPWPAGCGVG